MKKIKILYIGLSSNLGGIETYLHNLFKYMDKSKFEINFLVFKGKKVCFYDELKKSGIKIFEITHRKDNYVQFLKDLKELFSNNEFDFIHFNLMDFSCFERIIYANKYSNARIIIHSHNAGFGKNISLKTRILHKIGKLTTKNIDCLRIACGEEAGRWMFEKKDFKIFNNGINIEKFSYSEENRTLIREELEIKNDTTVIGLVGKFEKQKNHKFLIKIFNEYHKLNKNSKLILVGEGSLLKNIKKQVNNLDLKDDVIFLGKRMDSYKIYSALDIFLMPSLYEGLSIAITEAQVNGLKCYTSSNVDKACNFSNNVEFLDLNIGEKEWAERIYRQVIIREKNILKTIPQKYNIKFSSESLFNYYEKNEKRIKIITFHNAHNHGAMLQAYALQKKLLEYTNNVEIIDYRNKQIERQYKIFKPIRKNFFKWCKENIDSLRYYNKKKERYTSFENFKNTKLELTNKFNSEYRLKKDYPVAEIYITGSDQVWNTDIVGRLLDAYTLNFGDEKIKRISYAASIGNSNVKEKYKEIYKEKLSRLNFISVREEEGKKALQEIIDKSIDVVLDPVLLLTKEEWKQEIKSYTKEKEKYILAYVVEENEEHKKIVNYLSNKTGLKVIHFEKIDNYNNVIKNAYTEGPLEFVNLIKNAEYVVSTSFHATAFSTIFNKKFFIVPHKKTGSRVTNLLDKLEIRKRVYYSFEEFKNVNYNFETDWSKVEVKLNEEREKSINWLKNAIEG